LDEYELNDEELFEASTVNESDRYPIGFEHNEELLEGLFKRLEVPDENSLQSL
jgi:hypothetical protein